MTKNEVDYVISSAIKDSNKKSTVQISIDPKALPLIYGYSEGYPHFVQQIGYSAFEVNSDNLVSKEDIQQGFFMKNGALDCIGDRYYSKAYYTEITTDSQREILDIMANKWNEWVSREYILSQYKKGESALDNGLRALREKNTILAREGARGQYRLQWMSFAFWIKNHKRLTKVNAP